MAFEHQKWGAHGKVQREFLLRPLRRFRQALEYLQPFAEVGDCLDIGRTLNSILAGPLPIGERLRWQARLRIVVG
jgi:hypothetical protein